MILGRFSDFPAFFHGQTLTCQHFSVLLKTHNQAKRRAKTLYEKDERNGLVSYDSMDTEDTLGEEMIPDHSLPCVEDAALENLLREKLRYCLKQLPQTDQDLLHALYFEELSERQFADKLGLHHMTVHSRKVKILANLKKMINS